MTTDLGDISLGGVKYRVDLTSYKEKDLADFSPRASVPGGSVNMAELLLYQPLNMTDWRHGYGFLWHTDAMGYMRSYGDIDTRHPGTVMMSTTPVDISDTDKPLKQGLVMFDNVLYSWHDGTGGLRKYSSSTWSTIYTTANVQFCLATSGYLFICPEGARLLKMTPAGTITDAGIGVTTADIAYMAIHNGKIYANPEGTNRLHYGTDPELDDLDTREADDPDHIKVGGGHYPIIGMISYANYLYVFTWDGIYVVGDDNIARRVLDFASDASSYNFKGFAVYNGYLYFNVGPKIYQWNGARLTDVTPPRMGDRYPYSEIRYVGGMVASGGYLYVLAQWFNDEATSTDADSTISLFSFDGVGWHKLNDLLNFAYLPAMTPSPIIYDGYQRRLYAGVGVTGKTYLIGTPWNSVPKYPFGASLSTATAPYIKSPRLDMGFRRVQKSVPSILVEADNLSTISTEARYLTVDYYVDGSTIIETFGDVTVNGITELFPNQQDADPAPTQEFKNMVIMVRFVNAGASTNQTPILEGLTVRFLMRPDVFYGYSFGIVVAENYLYGTEQASTSAKDLRDALLTLRDSKAPIEFIDIYGDTHDVYISSVSLQAQERHENSEDGTNNIESIIVVNLVEAK